MGPVLDGKRAVKVDVKAFHSSILQGDYFKVESMLNQGIDPNVRDNSHRTALYVAAAAGQSKIARLLIERGANQNAYDASGLEQRMKTKLNEPMRTYLEALDKQVFAQAAKTTPQPSLQ